MKRLIVLSATLAIVGCAAVPKSMVLAPWECMSNTEPLDARVLRVENGYYIYDCNMNGDGDSGDDGQGDE